MNVLGRVLSAVGLRRQGSSFAGVRIHALAEIECNAHGDTIGSGTVIDRHARISSKDGGRIAIGKRCEIGVGALLLTYGGNIEIGDDCSFNPYCVIYGHGGLKIGAFVRIATQTVIIPANHRFADVSRPICKQGLDTKGIVIGDDVWIGAGVRIVDGVTIGSGVVIAAGSVVTRSVPDLSVIAGVPAKIIKTRRSQGFSERSST